jgi:hypothetical protein
MAKVVIQAGLDASGFHTGLQRLSAEGERFSSELNRKFSSSRIFGSILSGIGIGTGFALAQQAAEKIAGYWQDAADDAERLEKSTEDNLKTTRALIALNQTPQQRIDSMEKELRAAMVDFSTSQTQKTGIALLQPWLANSSDNMLSPVRTKKDKEATAAAEQKVNALTVQLAAAKKEESANRTAKGVAAGAKALEMHDQIAADKTDQVEKALEEFFKPLDAKSASMGGHPDQPITERINGNFRENISADSLAAIGGGGNVNAIGPINPLLAEAKRTNTLLAQINTSLANRPTGSAFDIRR